VIHLLHFIKKFVDDPELDSTISLWFNMLSPRALKRYHLKSFRGKRWAWNAILLMPA
jgi:hypothetical protein